VFNATFSNISAISWRQVLVVEEAGENHQPCITIGYTKKSIIQYILFYDKKISIGPKNKNTDQL
jgi:hypothetical protein